ncbi:MAG: DUF6493 family protein [Arachnia propionica]|uniref:DUF6493 family protein n=1 Tax=Arachnia propionica TaxID=1750 RepID=UPI00270BD048|nr:DUF6493 family protein [Arachnia propionica]
MSLFWWNRRGKLQQLLADPALTLEGLHRAEQEYAQEKDPQSITRETVEWMAQAWPQSADFVLIRLAELFEDLNLEHDDTYVLAMVSALGDRWDQGIREFMLRHDHDLRENVFWRVFEVEGGGEVSLANVDKFSREEAGWQASVLTLVHEGTLDRARVLRCCLEALTRDFSSYRAGWFSRTWLALTPSIEEAAQDQDLLFRCLGTGITATVSLAIKQLARLAKAGLLDGPGFVAAAAPALSAGKGTALTVVKLLEPLPDAAEVLAQGLTHEHVDVQRAVVKALTRLGRDDLVAADLVSPSLAAELGLSRERVEATAQMELPDRSARPVVPFTDEDALERVAWLLEDARDPVELELLLAWLATAEHPAERLASLRARVQKMSEPLRDHDILGPLLRAVFVLPEDKRRGKPKQWRFKEVPAGAPEDAEGLWRHRVLEVTEILTGQAPRRVLLATPTDSHGHLPGEVFLTRVAEVQERFGVDAAELKERCPGDLVQAAMRLSAADRGQAEQVLGFSLPQPSERVQLEWYRVDSDEKKPNGQPRWVWWRSEVLCVPNPGQKISGGRRRGLYGPESTPVLLMDPHGTAYIVAQGIRTAEWAVEDTCHREIDDVLKALSELGGTWTPETAQLVGLGLSGSRQETRSLAAELLAEAVPARLSVQQTAEGMAACVVGCKVNRWVSSLTDAAGLNPGMVVDLLTALLPRVDRELRGIGGLMQLLLDEQLRVGRVTEDGALRAWLAGFTGSSAAAKTAKKLLG